jgi:hypothetical protein
VRETPEDLDVLQQVLDRSYTSAGRTSCASIRPSLG